MTTSTAGVEFIKRWEGFSAKPYLCPAGVWTIGYGHTEGVTPSSPIITPVGADLLLRRDLKKFEQGVLEAVTPVLAQHQFDALVSFAFNLGIMALRSSTLLKRVNLMDYPGAAAEFPRWIYARDPKTGERRKLVGLVKRRAGERAIFERGHYELSPA